VLPDQLWEPGFYLGVTQPGLKANHSPPSNAEAKNVWNNTYVWVMKGVIKLISEALESKELTPGEPMGPYMTNRHNHLHGSC
jgi:hypothetical protein